MTTVFNADKPADGKLLAVKINYANLDDIRGTTVFNAYKPAGDKLFAAKINYANLDAIRGIIDEISNSLPVISYAESRNSMKDHFFINTFSGTLTLVRPSLTHRGRPYKFEFNGGDYILISVDSAGNETDVRGVSEFLFESLFERIK